MQSVAGFFSAARQLILLFNPLFNQKPACNQQTDMLCSLFQMKETYTQLSMSQDCTSIPWDTATLKHVVMQSHGFVCGGYDPSIHSQWALAAMSSCLSAVLSSVVARVSVDTDKVAAVLLSPRLKCFISSARQRFSSLCFDSLKSSLVDANPEQVHQCSALLLLL